MERAEALAGIRAFVLDMDGTIYLGDRLFPFTPKFLERARETGREVFFFTNNSSQNQAAYLEKLARMGIAVPPGRMLTANQVILEWLGENRPGQRAYVVGTPPLLADFQRAGVSLDEEDPDYVVLGFDTTLTYEKLAKACHLIRRGKPVYGVNPDWNCPVEEGFIPDCGSIAALVEASTGVRCEFFGKPSPRALSFLLRRTGRAPEELAVVGDRLYTDIAVAAGSAVTSILVMSGETTPAALAESAIQPDLVAQDLGDLADSLGPLAGNPA